MVPESQLGGPDEAARARRFLEEKNLLPRLNHPGLPRVRDFFRHEGYCCIVTDYIDGPSLEQELYASIKSHGHALGGREVARTALQVLEVLQYLHNLDPAVLHRDVKPANIVRESRSGRIMLVDLGLIRPAPELRPQPVGYTPPEQMQGHAEPRSDLYALGATMNQLLSGQPPVPLGIAPLASISPQTEPELASLVDRACSKPLDGRFASVREMGVALHGWLQRNSSGEEPAPTPVTAPPPGSEGVPDAISRGPGARLRPPAPVTFPQKPGALAGRPQVVPPMPTALRKDLSRMASAENHAAITASEPPAPIPAPLSPQPEPPAPPEPEVQEHARPEMDPTVRVPAITAPPQTEPTSRPAPRLGGQRPPLPSGSGEGLPPAYPPSAETERLAPPVARPVQVPSNSGQLSRLSAGGDALDAPIPPRPPLDAPLPPPLPPVGAGNLDAPLPPPLPWDRSKAPAPPPDTENNWSEPPEEPFKLKQPSIEAPPPAPAPPNLAAPRPPAPQDHWDAPPPPPLKLALERAEPAPTPAESMPPLAQEDPWAPPAAPVAPADEPALEPVSELEEAPEGEPQEVARVKKGGIPMPLMVMLALSAVIVIGFSAGKALLGKSQPTPTATRTEVATPTWTPPPPPPPPPPATATPVFAPVSPSETPSPEASATAEASPSASPSASESPDLALVNPDDEETPDESVVLPDPPTPAVQEDQSIKVDVPELGLSFQVPPGMELKRNNWGRQKADLHWRKTEAWGESRLNVRMRIGKSGVRLRSSAEGLLNHQWTSVAHEGPDQVNLFRPDGRGVAWFGQYKREDGNQVFITITYSWDGNLPKEGFEQAAGEVRRRITLPQ